MATMATYAASDIALTGNMCLPDPLTTEGHLGSMLLPRLEGAMVCTCRCVAEPTLGPLVVVAPRPLVIVIRLTLVPPLCPFLLAVGKGMVPRGSGTQKRPRRWIGMDCAVLPPPLPVRGRRRPPVQGGVSALEPRTMTIPYVAAMPKTVRMPRLRRVLCSSRGS